VLKGYSNSSKTPTVTHFILKLYLRKYRYPYAKIIDLDNRMKMIPCLPTGAMSMLLDRSRASLHRVLCLRCGGNATLVPRVEYGLLAANGAPTSPDTLMFINGNGPSTSAHRRQARHLATSSPALFSLCASGAHLFIFLSSSAHLCYVPPLFGRPRFPNGPS
jgi:hypothetical protein